MSGEISPEEKFLSGESVSGYKLVPFRVLAEEEEVATYRAVVWSEGVQAVDEFGQRPVLQSSCESNGNVERDILG